MSVAINRVTIAGNLTRDPELKPLDGGRVVGRLSLAINRHWRGDDGQRKEEVTYVEVEAWGRSAELAGQYLSKGSPCLIEGRLRMDQWQSADGKKQSRLKVLADSIQFLGGRNDDERGAENSYDRSTNGRPTSGNSAYGRRSGQRRAGEGPSLEQSSQASEEAYQVGA